MTIADTEKAQDTTADLSRLRRMGIVAWEQVLLSLPKGYSDYTQIEERMELPFFEKDHSCYALTILSKPSVTPPGVVPPRVSFMVSDGENEARLTAFGDTYTWRNLVVVK